MTTLKWSWHVPYLWGGTSSRMVQVLPKKKKKKTERNPRKWHRLEMMTIGKKNKVIAAETGHTNYVTMEGNQQPSW